MYSNTSENLAKANKKAVISYSEKIKLAEESAMIFAALENTHADPQAQLAILRKANAAVNALEAQITERHMTENSKRLGNEILSIDGRLAKDYSYNDAKLRADIDHAQVYHTFTAVSSVEEAAKSKPTSK